MSTQGGHTRKRHVRSVYGTRNTHKSLGFDPTARSDAEAVYGPGQIVHEQVPSQQIAEGAVGAGHLQDGSFELSAFAQSVRPVAIVDSLPTLPDADYPEFSYVVLTTDERLYKNIADAWVLGVDGADIVANSITAGQIAAGAIATSELSAGAVTTEKLATGAISLSDEFGETILSPSGFDGSWHKFLGGGLYNYDFKANTTGTPSLGRTSDVPYWSLVNSVGTGQVWNVSGPGQISLALDTVGDAGYFQSDKVPVSRGTRYRVYLKEGMASGTVDRQVAILYYDLEGTHIVTESLDVTTLSTASETWFESSSFVPDSRSDGSFFYQVGFISVRVRPLAATLSGGQASYACEMVSLVKGASDTWLEKASGDLTLTTSYQDVPGCTIDVWTGQTYVATWSADIEITTAGVGNAVGAVSVDGVTLSSPQAVFAAPTATARATVSQSYKFYVPFDSGATVTVKLVGKKSINAGVAAIKASHSTLTVRTL